MMKYVFVLVLLMVGGVASVLGGNVGYRWFHNMTESPRIMPGERAFSMPPGSVPRGGELRLLQGGARDGGAPAEPDPRDAGLGPEGRRAVRHLLHALPRGARGKGDGLVSDQVRARRRSDQRRRCRRLRTDGYWQSYLSVGGAVMPSYGEALSAEERWHVVNFLRTLAQQ